MTTKLKSPHRTTGTHTVGRHGFAKISAVEGIALSRETEMDFREFDRRGLSAAERRKALLKKYGRKA